MSNALILLLFDAREAFYELYELRHGGGEGLLALPREHGRRGEAVERTDRQLVMVDVGQAALYRQHTAEAGADHNRGVRAHVADAYNILLVVDAAEPVEELALHVLSEGDYQPPPAQVVRAHGFESRERVVGKRDGGPALCDAEAHELVFGNVRGLEQKAGVEQAAIYLRL